MPFYRVHAYDNEHYATLVIHAEVPEQTARGGATLTGRAWQSRKRTRAGWPTTPGFGCRAMPLVVAAAWQ